MSACLHRLNKVFTGSNGTGAIATSKDVSRGVPVFRPGVDGYMRFRDKGKGSYALRMKTMGHFMQKRRHALFYGIANGLLDVHFVIEQVLGAIIQLSNTMNSAGFQWSDSPPPRPNRNPEKSGFGCQIRQTHARFSSSPCPAIFEEPDYISWIDWGV